MRLIRFLKAVVTLCLILFSSKAFAGFTEGLTFARSGNFDAAIAELTPLADNGDMNSQFVLATIYRKHVKNPKLSLKYMTEASKNGSLKATNYMGLWNLQGYHNLVAIDENKAIKIFSYVAEWRSDKFKADKAYANGMLGHIYARRGERGKELKYFSQSAALGPRFRLDYVRSLLGKQPSKPIDIARAFMWVGFVALDGSAKRADEAEKLLPSIRSRLKSSSADVATQVMMRCDEDKSTCDSTLEKMFAESSIAAKQAEEKAKRAAELAAKKKAEEKAKRAAEVVAHSSTLEIRIVDTEILAGNCSYTVEYKNNLNSDISLNAAALAKYSNGQKITSLMPFSLYRLSPGDKTRQTKALWGAPCNKVGSIEIDSYQITCSVGDDLGIKNKKCTKFLSLKPGQLSLKFFD